MAQDHDSQSIRLRTDGRDGKAKPATMRGHTEEKDTAKPQSIAIAIFIVTGVSTPK